ADDLARLFPALGDIRLMLADPGPVVREAAAVLAAVAGVILVVSGLHYLRDRWLDADGEIRRLLSARFDRPFDTRNPRTWPVQIATALVALVLGVGLLGGTVALMRQVSPATAEASAPNFEDPPSGLETVSDESETARAFDALRHRPTLLRAF